MKQRDGIAPAFLKAAMVCGAGLVALRARQGGLRDGRGPRAESGPQAERLARRAALPADALDPVIAGPDESERVWRPNLVWQIGATKLRLVHGTAELHVAIDCCTREIVAWDLTGSDERLGVAEALQRAGARRGVDMGQLRMDVDDGQQPTLVGAWIEGFERYRSWQRDWVTAHDARLGVAACIDEYHSRPIAQLGGRTPIDVACTWTEVEGGTSTRSR